MGLEFSSANLNNQMWEQKTSPPHHLPATLAPPTAATPVPRASTPHLWPHLCSLLPGPHIRGAQYAQTLIRITLKGRQGKGRNGGGGGWWVSEGRRSRTSTWSGRTASSWLRHYFLSRLPNLILFLWIWSAGPANPLSTPSYLMAELRPFRVISSAFMVTLWKSWIFFPFAPIYNVGGLACNGWDKKFYMTEHYNRWGTEHRTWLWTSCWVFFVCLFVFRCCWVFCCFFFLLTMPQIPLL